MASKNIVSVAGKAFSVVESGGKQHLVVPGATLHLEKLIAAEGDKVTFDKVLLTVDEAGKATIGTPYIAGATVEVDVLTQGRAKKIRIVHFKSKSNRHKVNGHRQPFTAVKIAKI